MVDKRRFEIPQPIDYVEMHEDRVAVCILSKQMGEQNGLVSKTISCTASVFDLETGMEMPNEPMFACAITLVDQEEFTAEVFSLRIKAIANTTVPRDFYKVHGICKIISLNQDDQIEAISQLKNRGYNALVDTIHIWWPEEADLM